MDKLLSKKINLLIHLAHIDGKFDSSEKLLLRSILEENGFEEEYLEVHKQHNVDLGDLIRMPGKEELLYWTLKLIHADGHLHLAELAYARVVAKHLGFNEEFIDHFTTLPATFAEFENKVRNIG